ncbi:lytic murein transglycosylase [Candidatus Berkelbacteria bacterium]|nr:lytic murein transglycosylase [Candidatus Berkelbacteria bacterium]
MMRSLDLSRRVKHGIETVQTYLTQPKLSAWTLLSAMAGYLLTTGVLPAQGLTLPDTLVSSVQAADEDRVAVPLVFTPVLVDFVQATAESTVSVTLVESRADAAARLKQEEEARAKRALRSQSTQPATPAADVPLEVKRALVQAAAAQYGLDWKILEAVWQVESGKRWQTTVRSSAGAQGPMQFMPGTWRAYAVDGNGDGVANVNDARDAVYAGARLLATNGGATNIDQALLRYNHAGWYVTKVKAVASSIE